MKHFVYLIIGIAVTLLFFVLSCSDSFNIYEQLFFNQGYNDKMYNLNMYPVIAAITIMVAWGAAAIYYYAIDSVKFDRWYHWLAVLGVVAVLTPVVCYIYNDTKFASAGLMYISESITFEFQTMLFSALLFIVASYSMRWWSRNCRHTPLPQ